MSTAGFTSVTLPSMGEGIQEATIVKWLKREGDVVQKGEPLLEVTTDKVDTEIASPGEGFLRQILLREGAIARVDQLIGVLARSMDAEIPQELLYQPLLSTHTKKTESKGSQEKPRSTVISQPVSRNVHGHQLMPPTAQSSIPWVRTSPLVRSLAREHQVPLAVVPGTGLHGRITRDDFFAYLHNIPHNIPDSHEKIPDTHLSSAEGERLRAKKDGCLELSLELSWQGEQEFLDGTPIRREKMSTMRRLTAEHMLRSVRTSPHVTTTFEIDLWRVKSAREKQKAAFLAAYGHNLSYTPYFIYAAAQALIQHPEINAAVDCDEILWRKDINIGCAVATPRGLIVPVLKGLAAASLKDIARGLNDLVARAREGKLRPAEVHAGTFTVTNPGMFGSLHSQPIINQPQVAILSIGAIVEKPVFFAGEITVHPLCQVGLTFDHRLIDGEGGAKFLGTLQRVLEQTIGDETRLDI
jgi:2-oxoglutarate dehydrogenase E2 component (dihydrolipoamide succinyltransferase)